MNDVIVERVNETDVPEPGEVYFIPHQAVIRKHAASTHLRIVFDASSKARSDFASLNECLFTGPSLTPEIMNVLIRFRVWKFGLVADLRKAFHQIQINEKHRNFLRFIWLEDILSDNPKLLILRFQRVIFGVNSSAVFLDYHISKYFEADSELMNNILWWRGPPWIEREKEYWPRLNDELLEPNEDCLKELNYPSYNRLLRVTAYVIKFIRILQITKNDLILNSTPENRL